MSERLVIKNFGPIKQVDLDLRQVNVLIGENGTGKSTISKVLAIFRDNKFYLDQDFLRFNYYNIESYFNEKSHLQYTNDKLKINVNLGKIKIEFLLPELANLFSNIKNEEVRLKKESTEKAVFYDNFHKLVTDFRLRTSSTIYIPTERSIVSQIKIIDFYQNATFSNSDYLKAFFLNYTVCKEYLNTFFIKELGLRFEFDKNSNKETVEFKGIKSELKLCSSGVQNIIPLVICIPYSANVTYPPFIYFTEEPEICLFPNQQKLLLNYLVDIILKRNNDLFITTHSPYILTSLNNLMYAYKVGNMQGKKSKAEAILAKEYWLNPENVSAYLIHENGTAENIKDNEGLIKTEKIDEISKHLNSEFNELMDIELGIK